MSNNSLKSIKFNALSGYINFTVNSLFIFFISPYLIQFLGDNIFGIWKSIQKILSFTSIADGKSTQALKWIIANEESKTDIKIKRQGVGSALIVWLSFLPIVISLLIIVVYNLPVFINDLDFNLYEVVYEAGIILGVNLLMDPLLKIPDAILTGSNYGYKSNFIRILGVIISNLLMLLTSMLGYGLIGLAYVVMVITLLNAILIFWVCKKTIPWLGLNTPTRSQLNKFFRFNFWVFLWSFVMKLILATEIILIGYFISSKAVSKYVFTTYLIQLLVSIAVLSSSAITPSLGKFIGANDTRKSELLTKALRDFIKFIAVLIGSLIILANKDFVSLWMDESYYLGSNANILIVLTMTILIITRSDGQIQDLSLNIKSKVISGLFFAFVSIGLGALGYIHFVKIEAIFLGILIGRILMNLVFTRLLNKFINIRAKYLSIFLILSILLFISSIEEFIPTVDSWVAFSIKVFIILFITMPLYYFLLFSKSSKKLIASYIISNK